MFLLLLKKIYIYYYYYYYYYYFYKRYVDDTLTVMKDEVSVYSFLHVLNDLHPLISFTMELPIKTTLSFLGMVVRKDSQNILRDAVGGLARWQEAPSCPFG